MCVCVGVCVCVCVWVCVCRLYDVKTAMTFRRRAFIVWHYIISFTTQDQQYRSGLNCVHMNKVDSKMLHAVVATDVPKMSDLGLLVRMEIDHEANQEWTHCRRRNGSPVFPSQEVSRYKHL